MLPSPIRSAFEANGEILEALVPDFSLESFLSLVPEGVEQIVVQSQSASPNLDLWLLQQSHIIKSTLGSDVPDMPELRDFGFSRQLGLKHGGSLFLAKRKARPEVLVAYRLPIIMAVCSSCICIPQGGSTNLGVTRLALVNHVNQILPNTVELSPEPKFLWVTEFPLFTHADEDKEFLAHGRWSSSHHPFTAPMREDIEKMYSGKVEEVRISR